ncbi:uncharacterized protein BX663DRAFT_138622 [Cokeromyces recurvatus]|uniref:uncharacterized protein n=1 Tax=Cokeromyces recurvatus TaxID=90255 RepID=UPI00221E4CA3|nr:uncharacterized protein BX663DRAFT_138622 [Cokeromyces recurvatus]KAI7900892.1 hypothetical protein BX663DRAFT_138622 [Cokeromyces recurvatus]
MKCPSCGGTDHERSSSAKCPYRVKRKAETHKDFNRTSIVKANLINCCKNEKKNGIRNSKIGTLYHTNCLCQCYICQLLLS